MPRAPTLSRKQFIDGITDVLDWELEQALLRGQTMFGPLRMLQCRRDWERAWSRWADVILPKALQHRPGLRPFAMYATGEIEPRELRVPLPPRHRWSMLRIPDHTGQAIMHYLDVPEPYIECEARHLHHLGIVNADEMRRHRAWMRTASGDCGRGAPDTYPLEMSLYE